MDGDIGATIWESFPDSVGVIVGVILDGDIDGYNDVTFIIELIVGDFVNGTEVDGCNVV